MTTLGVGRASRERALLGKVHQLKSGAKPAEPHLRRNRTDARTACGLWVQKSWSFEVTTSNACQKCFPKIALDPVSAEAARLEKVLATEEPSIQHAMNTPEHRVSRLDIGRSIPLNTAGEGEPAVIGYFVPIHIERDAHNRITVTLVDALTYMGGNGP